MKSIKYSPEMATARKEGNKTQTRIPMKPQPVGIRWSHDGLYINFGGWYYHIDDVLSDRCPYGQVGDELRAEEIVNNHIEGIGQLVSLQGKDKITGIRIERVQDITSDDAKAEGVPSIASYKAGTPTILMTARKDATYKNAFSILWDSFYGETEYSWDKNCWVWIIDFEVLK